MKDYPVIHFLAEVDGGTMYVTEPTHDAICNFNSYLDEDEMAFYNTLSDAEKLSIMISKDPFRMLLFTMRKI